MGTNNAMSNYLEQKILEAILKNTTYTAGANTYVALYTAAPGEGSAGTEVSGGSYARQAMAAASAWSAGGQVSAAYEVNNAADIAFPTATADWGEILSAGLLDASSGGNLLYRMWLSSVGYTFTGLASSDVFTAYGHTLANGNRVILQGASLPTGVSEDTVYYVVGVSGDTFQLSLTSGGSAINITASGAGQVQLLAPKTITNGDTFKFLTGTFKVAVA